MADEFMENVGLGAVFLAFLSPFLGFFGYFAFRLAKFGWWVAGLFADFFSDVFHVLFARFLEQIG